MEPVEPEIRVGPGGRRRRPAPPAATWDRSASRPEAALRAGPSSLPRRASAGKRSTLARVNGNRRGGTAHRPCRRLRRRSAAAFPSVARRPRDIEGRRPRHCGSRSTRRTCRGGCLCSRRGFRRHGGQRRVRCPAALIEAARRPRPSPPSFAPTMPGTPPGTGSNGVRPRVGPVARLPPIAPNPAPHGGRLRPAREGSQGDPGRTWPRWRKASPGSACARKAPRFCFFASRGRANPVDRAG